MAMLDMLSGVHDSQHVILIIDELGDSLGDVNHKQVLSAVSGVALRQEVTITGTCLWGSRTQALVLTWASMRHAHTR